MGFCPACGKPVEAGAAFCGGCGGRLEAGAAPQVPPQAATPRPAVPAAGVPGARAGGGGCGKALLVGGLILGLLAALVIGGFVYVAYRAKKKVDEVKQAYKENDLDKMAAALGGKPAASKTATPLPNFPGWNPGNPGNVAPASAGGAASSPTSYGSVLPIRKGMTMTAAVEEPRGDYETLLQIVSVGDDGVLMNLSSGNVPVPENPFDKSAPGSKPKTTSVHGRRRILAQDMKTAHEYAEEFSELMPDTFPGTFSLGFSSEMYTDLKSKGATPLTYWQVGLKGALGNLVNGLGGLAVPKGGPGDGGVPPEVADIGKARCTLMLKDQKLYSFPVLVNGERKQIPALRSSCTSEGGKADFYFLDDPANALILAWQIGSSDRAQLTKVDYPAEAQGDGGQGGPGRRDRPEGSGGAGAGPAATAGARQLEEKLAREEKVEIYGIYFDFASAAIRPESRPTLDEIAAVMKAHPDWKLNVAGHTDNVGGDAFNLDLSRQRAEAVKAALASQYRVAPERLLTSGYGASQPVESNDTLEGRARNRRVELSRQ